MNLPQNTISKELHDEFIIPQKFDNGQSISVLFSILFYSHAPNTVFANLAGHFPACLTIVSILSFPAPKFWVPDDASLLEQLLLGALERISEASFASSVNGNIGLQLDSAGLTE